MIDFYPQIKALHVAAVVASGALFFVRGAATVAGAQWVMRAPLRYFSYFIDTVLLAAAVLLAVMLHQYPFVNAWLTAKVLLLLLYIVLGSYAVKRGRSRAVRLGAWLAALAVYAFIISIARAHDPWGVFSALIR